MDTLTMVILLLIIGVVLYSTSDTFKSWVDWATSCGQEQEGFGNGALQSLYSNDGAQDIHLTVNNDSGYGAWGGYWGGYGWGYDPYRYWRGVPWYLPTRNLNRVSYYPYLYDYRLDRYGRYYPYW